MQNKDKRLWIKISPLPLMSDALGDLLRCGFVYHEQGYFSSSDGKINSAVFAEVLSKHGVWVEVLDDPPQISKLEPKAVQLMLITGAIQKVL